MEEEDALEEDELYLRLGIVVRLVIVVLSFEPNRSFVNPLKRVDVPFMDGFHVSL